MPPWAQGPCASKWPYEHDGVRLLCIPGKVLLHRESTCWKYYTSQQEQHWHLMHVDWIFLYLRNYESNEMKVVYGEYSRQVLLFLKQQHSSSHSPVLMGINLIAPMITIGCRLVLIWPDWLLSEVLLEAEHVRLVMANTRVRLVSSSVTLMSSMFCLEDIFSLPRTFVCCIVEDLRWLENVWQCSKQ